MKRLVTRADDFGSGLGANHAILEACDGGFIQNVSVMAGGPFVEEGADVLARSGKCIGMHAVLNSEWDRVKWTPCAPKKNIPSLLDEDGEFPWQTAWFLEHPPELSEILREFDAQLDRLTALGLPVSYVDMHMMPYPEVPGLQEEMSRWIAQKGLIDHMPYYHSLSSFGPENAMTPEEGLAHWREWLSAFEDGQYFCVLHPFCKGEGSELMGNADVPTAWVEDSRETEYQLLVSGALERLCKELEITPVRYDEL
ncbi:MAG: ChbG/HpnK family deacetylase [Clostridia bacterium]|nr:ChbG/HpnK family deacetylase [Clostridia bacterium]